MCLMVQVFDRMLYDESAKTLQSDAKPDMEALSAKLCAAQNMLPQVTLSQSLAVQIASVCSNLRIDGLRGDMVVNRAARALVAFQGRSEVRLHFP